MPDIFSLQYSCHAALKFTAQTHIRRGGGEWTAELLRKCRAPATQPHSKRLFTVLCCDIKAEMPLKLLPSGLSSPWGSVVHENDPSLVYCHPQTHDLSWLKFLETELWVCENNRFFVLIPCDLICFAWQTVNLL